MKMPQHRQIHGNLVITTNVNRQPNTRSESNVQIFSRQLSSDPLYGGPSFDESTRRSIFPCLHPAHQHMRDEADRYNTFGHSTNWPSYRIEASPREIARAGLFYTGVSDRVKCWYCGGGLQNWERYDEPWREHAKWYPTCEYILQQKGPEYIHRIVRQYPDLARPNMTIRRNVYNFNEPIRIVQSRPAEIHGYHRQPSTSIQIIDPRVEAQRATNRIDEEMQSEHSRRLQNMGFDVGHIRSAVTRQIQNNQERFASLEEFLDAVLSISPETASTSNISPSYHEEPEAPIDIENLSAAEGARELHRLREARKCKICRNERACMVLIPCGHLASCVNCGRNIQTCPVCQADVNERVRSYIV